MATPPPVGVQEMPILWTKLYIPPLRSEWVSRPRLIERLDAGLQRKLTLVSAPAGFGKTTLVGEWVAGRRRREPKARIAWLSLDEGDNDPTRFLTYLIAALQAALQAGDPSGAPAFARGALDALQSPQPPPTELILTALINELVTLADPVVLVLDDYHLVDAQPVHDALAFLLDHLPPPPGGVHLVVATREDPPLPLARLRARRQLVELRATDLRFTSFEAAEFLNQVMGLDLSAEDVAALERRTEGWIAGLQLASLALQGASMQGHGDVTRFIRSFTGSHRFVLDYLLEEVLQQQPTSVQAFLLQTALLDRLTGSLCDALTGREDGQATLEQLERANLFIVSLDEERCWYRYHHLFAELLQRRLVVTCPDSIGDLHARAAAWYEAHGDLPAAIHHVLAVEDVETAIRLIETGAPQALERSELRFILNWVDRLPDGALENAPWLFVYHSWALLLTGQVERVSSRTEHLDRLRDSVTVRDGLEQTEMLGFIDGLMAVLKLWQADFQVGIGFARKALQNLPRSSWIRGYCAIVMGSSFWASGHLDAAKDAFAESYSVGMASGNRMLAVSSACNLAYVIELGGRLQQAAELLQGSFQLAVQDGKTLPVAGYIHVDLSRILYEWNDLDAAYRHLQEGIELCQRLADGRAEKIGFCLLVRVQLAQGQYADARDSIQKAQDADPSPSTRFDLRGGEYPRVRLWLKEEKLPEIEAWYKESGIDAVHTSHLKGKLNYIMHARALIALGREHAAGAYLHDAQELLEGLLAIAEQNGWENKAIEILALQAMAFDAEGDTAQAMTALERALTLAEPEGFVRTFVDEGPPMAGLLYKAMARGIVPDYAGRLLAAFPAIETLPVAQPEISKSQISPSEIVEPLSERELEVLQLLAEGLTNQEIASRLYLSLNTVKAHSRNIYGKLGVHSRTQAVARARALGILDPLPRHLKQA